ncbi:Bromodomain associated domain [Arabidopsis thaliana x Arabidopsis arenosa]|uniref:Bromodomain associated domain n=1 Tax=Arabidopsis thaliana x Arabidopsis arenosa TaxID=1240361 RepID=A0A8T2EI34_9BRAS|nr:Bromodomain associated domain [Arabidopsis thaliana x Arabidopsis arenosa]
MVLHVMLGEVVTKFLNMNNGVGEGGSQQRELHGKRKLFRGNDFAFSIARMAVAQICESVEVNPYQESQTREGVRFSSFQESALDTLTDVAVQYIQSIGKTAHLYANLAGRVDVKDIIRYTGEAEEIPFVYSLPRFPFSKEKKPAPSFSEVGAEPPDEHIPVWLPAFPETELCDRSEETNAATIEGEIPSKENGSSLPSMQLSFDGGGRLEIHKSSKDVGESTEAVVEGNLFLTAPLRFVEKNVSPVVRPLELSNEVVRTNHVPDKHVRNNHHIPILEASAPSDKINNKNWLAISKDVEKVDVARKELTLVRFKIGTTKRSMCLAKSRSFQEEGWFQEGEDKREKTSEIKEKRERIDSQLSTQM